VVFDEILISLFAGTGPFTRWWISFISTCNNAAGGEVGFPAFNVADSAICTGVGLIFLITWKNEHAPKKPEATTH